MKRRTFLMLSSAVAGGFAVSGCSGTTQPAGGGASGGSTALSLYSSSPKDQYEPAVSAFKKSTGIDVEVVSAGTGELIKRIQAEGNNPQADVQWGGLGQSVAGALDRFEEFVPADDAAFLPAYQASTGRDKRLVPFSIILNAFMVNTKQTSSAITSWEALLDPTLKGKIAFADPAKSSSSLSQIVNMLHAMGHGNPEQGWDYVGQFAKQLNNKLQASSSNVYNMVSSGEYAVGITNETNAVKYAVVQPEIKTIYPSEGTMVEADNIMLIKGAKNAANGKTFINYLTGKDYQSGMEEVGLRTVRVDVTQKAFPALASITVVEQNKAWMQENGSKIKDRFMDLFTR
ncbi:extracellular solute-binding protein [Propioniciclava flava]|uniref:ABC transporter substrate-binding protein n=1 Tax=Propioniciclava flava TaxID=2072026 RepID=A0A4Q2EEE2_9ACTN|nr:extracellular solute-binding protein [Propioniciclava flava]RXW31313.1 ABC transporter substrate-binding protein [Propioniciclava flava]